MKPIKINPFFKFAVLVLQMILLITTSSNTLATFIIVTSIIVLIIKRVSGRLVINGLKFGILLACFMFLFSLIRYQNITLAILNGWNLLIIYIAMILASIVYKLDTSNNEIAYVLSVVFSPLKVIGFDQNKLYTLFLMVLNQIFTMRKSSLRIHKYAKRNKGSKLTISEVISLIIPFISNNLKQNEVLAIGLLNSGYNSQIKRVKPYFIVQYSNVQHILLIIFVAIEIFILGV